MSSIENCEQSFQNVSEEKSATLRNFTTCIRTPRNIMIAASIWPDLATTRKKYSEMCPSFFVLLPTCFPASFLRYLFSGQIRSGCRAGPSAQMKPDGRSLSTGRVVRGGLCERTSPCAHPGDEKSCAAPAAEIFSRSLPLCLINFAFSFSRLNLNRVARKKIPQYC